jgi:hypothetical protein
MKSIVTQITSLLGRRYERMRKLKGDCRTREPLKRCEVEV